MMDDSDSDYTLEDSECEGSFGNSSDHSTYSVEVHRNRQTNLDDDNRFFPGKIAKS